MSDEQPERGWWLATDGQWYPPEQHPDFGGRIGTDATAPIDEAVGSEFEEDTDDESFPFHELDHLSTHVEPEVPPQDQTVDDRSAESFEPDDPPVVEPTEPLEPTTVVDHLDGPERDASLGDQLLDLSNRRVAGLLSDDEFAEAQRRLLTGEDVES